MQKLTLLGSYLVLASTLFLSLSRGSEVSNDATIAKLPASPTPQELKAGALSTFFDETKRLCNGNQLKDKYSNPKCSGWWLTQFDSNDESLLGSSYSDECALGVDGSFRCFFREAEKACQAYAKAHQNDHPAFPNPFCGCGYYVNTTDIKCGWCKKQTGCSNGQFIAGDKCPDNTDPFNLDDIYLSQIPEYAYRSYCALEVNGPYRNLYADAPEQYTVCGTEYTPIIGMEFVRDQRNKVKAANRNKNGGKIKSDLAGFCYDPPKGNVRNCIKQHSTITGKCEEPGLGPNEYLTGKRYEKNEPQVHHVVPSKDRRGCPCGKNSVKNAAIISAQLNQYFLNRNRTGFLFDCTSGMTEIDKVNGLVPYDPLPTSMFAPERKRIQRNKPKNLRSPGKPGTNK